MPFPSPASYELENASTVNPSDGPAAHEDLTIAEQLKMMRVPSEHRPGELCYLDSKDEYRWVAETAMRHFVVNHGAEHSSDYLLTHGADWEDVFFSAV